MRGRVAFDTNVLIDYPASLETTDYLSSVVVQEITAGSEDEDEAKFWEGVSLRFEKHGRLLVPTAQDCGLREKS